MKPKQEIEFALFSCPKPFTGPIAQIQTNAWRSWQQIPNCSVYICGDEVGIKDAASRVGFSTLPEVSRNDFGTPRLDCMFEQATLASEAPVLAYVNSDIILLPEIIDCIAAARAKFERFLMVARRWDFDCHEDLDFSDGWDQRLKKRVLSEGSLFTPAAIDLFVFSRGLFLDLPPFVVGRDYWDNGLLMLARRSGVPLIDATPQLMIVHQEHSHPVFGSPDERRRSPESRRHFAMLGDSYAMLGRTTDATHVLEDGTLRPSEAEPITVVIPHRGSIRSLCRCLLALEHQTFPRSFIKVVVVNNDPESPLRYLEQEFPTVTVVREHTQGAAATRNKGVSCANTSIVALFDSDTVPTSMCLEKAVGIIKAHPQCDVLVCHLEPAFSRTRQGYFSRSAEWFDARTHYNQEHFIRNSQAFASAALIVRRKVFSEFGTFNEVFPEAASEDWEWSKRIIASGASVMFAPEAVVRHPTTRSLRQLRAKKRRYARGDCIYKTLQSNVQEYRIGAILADEGLDLWHRLRQAYRDRHLPTTYRIGFALMAFCCVWWTVRAKLFYRKEAHRLINSRTSTVWPRAYTPENTHEGEKDAIIFVDPLETE